MAKKKTTPNVRKQMAPFTDGKGAKPHYEGLAPSAAEVKPTPRPTPPGKEAMTAGSSKLPKNTSKKSDSLDYYRKDAEGKGLTTNMGVKIANNQNTLRISSRGPSLMEDFHFHEKLAHFDRERIPERVVHARGSGAHGYFQVYKPLTRYTKAAFLQSPKEKTPVFVRFSTVQGFRGSPDTVRDIRGWATKFYTSEGNFDLVGNNTGVFFIQDAIKFPDFVHAVKPEPHNEVPQGQSAHDSFWDYVSLQPETLHNVFWAMSDRGIPRSYRTMEGFGIHTYKLVNEKGKVHFVRFHWKPVYGTASLLWDESQALTGRDPDFHRKDLWQAIEAGDYPEYELGLQIIPEADEMKFDFDILDPTKIIPEALVPIQKVGKMVLNRNPDNFFAETEQVAFCPANIVPGIDFSDDPLLQGRVFSYVDTQRHRLGGPNFHEIPINRPLVPVMNHQRDGFHRMQIDKTVANYEPNSISNNWPREVPEKAKDGGFSTSLQKVMGAKVRERSKSFTEYYAHPRLFWLSQTDYEKQHMINAITFELSNVGRMYIRERIVDLLSRVDTRLAKEVAENLGMKLTREQMNRKMPKAVGGLKNGDPALSLYAKGKQVVKGRRVSILVADGVDMKSVTAIQKILDASGIHSKILADTLRVQTSDRKIVMADGLLEANPSLFVDGVIVGAGSKNIERLMKNGDAKYHLSQAYKHLKPIAFPEEAVKMVSASGIPEDKKDAGLILGGDAIKCATALVRAMKKHRIWERESKIKMIAA